MLAQIIRSVVVIVIVVRNSDVHVVFVVVSSTAVAARQAQLGVIQRTTPLQTHRGRVQRGVVVRRRCLQVGRWTLPYESVGGVQSDLNEISSAFLVSVQFGDLKWGRRMN